ncbi:AraC family transcriptional regulator [Telmatospirillum sp.]|uniref:AraC family transcriptional regulator n=1 Tax=Telmatospirillum sp. TaxID=2079197 RepID=UPI00284D0B69|nr:AraC family transcriptional regulator [Telmatospirillum sp.]MDR3439917.1 AraC family transcriptional regulator [Telmatospirillum sp.]
MCDRTSSDRIELIDFGAASPPSRFVYTERIAYDGIIVARCLLSPNPGTLTASLQHTIAVHESEPHIVAWRLPEAETTEQCRMAADDLLINAAEHPLYLRWLSAPRALIIALEQAFLNQVANDAFNMDGAVPRTMVAIRDPVIGAMAVAWRQELAERGRNGKLYAEHLGLALAIHLLRSYADGTKPLKMVTGGLTARRLRLVADYMDAHLNQDISLGDLARTAGLSPHHFSDAFKTSTGRSPHRYLIDQRIRRAKELLLGSNRSITEIALDVGFANHSHFTDQFRKRTNTTPSRYRMDRK